MSPSWPGRPSSIPAINTPTSKSGRICFANFHDSANQSPGSPARVLVMTESPRTATANVTSGSPGMSSAETEAAPTTAPTFQSSRSNQRTRITASANAATEVMIHFAE